MRHVAGPIVLLAIMFGLMLGTARTDSATVDEATFLGGGYSYWTGYRFYLVPEHPPLSQMLPAMPLLFMDLELPPRAKSLLEKRAGYTVARPWSGPIRPLGELFPEKGRDDWYYWAVTESLLFGHTLVFGGANDAEAMLLGARSVQIALTLSVGVLIFFGVRRVASSRAAALAALGLWVFSPVALAHGHLVTTDMGVTLATTAALVLFARWLERPGVATALLCGAATGAALVMKHTAVVLFPIFAILLVVSWKQVRSRLARPWISAGVFFAAAWLLVLLVYFPHWTSPPPLPAAQAEALGVPGWFRFLRPLLIPRDYFKGLALGLGHLGSGQQAYLLGRWSPDGWWYYYPLTFLLKSPLAFVILVAWGAWAWARRLGTAHATETTAWVAAGTFLLLTMTSNYNIGVRHLLPIFPLLCIGIGCALPRLRDRSAKAAAAGLLAWQALVVSAAYPHYLPFFSEAVGGAAQGHKYLLDSNYDWGQNAKRLKTFLRERSIEHVYLNYFGAPLSIEYLEIPHTPVTAEQARELRQGHLVVSAFYLMRPEWSWLRKSRSPIARVGYGLFVYEIRD